MTRASAGGSGLATLDDVARVAGVSLATASRVLNGSTRKVADSYRERVEAAAASLGYSANLSAQATARGRGAVVDLLVADIADPYFGEIAAGVARGADEAGLIVTMAVTERDPEPLAAGTLVWGVSDVVAVGAMGALRAAGRTPGVDVAVAGFDGIPLTRDVSPSLTTVRVPLEEIGYRALRAAVDAQWSPDEAPLPYEVVLGESTPRR